MRDMIENLINFFGCNINADTLGFLEVCSCSSIRLRSTWGKSRCATSGVSGRPDAEHGQADARSEIDRGNDVVINHGGNTDIHAAAGCYGRGHVADQRVAPVPNEAKSETPADQGDKDDEKDGSLNRLQYDVGARDFLDSPTIGCRKRGDQDLIHIPLESALPR